MDKYIQALLALNKSVILPEFGALSITNEETGEAMFNAYLKFNDGKLEKYIAEQEGIEKQDAANMVAKYVRDLELLLNKGETYDIFQFGRFIKHEDGSFDFENWAAFSEEGSSTYIAPKTDKKEFSLDNEEDISELKEIKKEHITEEELSTITEVYEKPAERTLSEDEKKQSQNKFVPSETKVEKTESTSTAKDDISPEKKVVIEQPKSVKKQAEENKEKIKKKRSVFFFPMILLILLLGSAGVLVGIFPEEAKKLVGWEEIEHIAKTEDSQEKVEDKETESDDMPNIENDESMDEDVVTDEIIDGFTESDEDEQTTNPEPQIETSVAPAVTDGNYHIIVGSFGEKQNAENLVKSLQSKGYSAQIIGPVNNLHMVSFGSFPTQAAAQENLQKAIGETGGGWILKR